MRASDGAGQGSPPHFPLSLTDSALPCYRSAASDPGGGAGRSPREQRRDNLRLVTQYSAGTLELGVSVAVGAGIGYWLDSVFHTAPWLTLFWLLCGVVAGFRSLLRVARRLEKDEEETNRDG